MFVDQFAKAPARPAIGGIDLNLFAGLGIFQRDDANVWQHLLPFVANMDCNEIMTPSAHRQRPREIRRLKIRDKKYDCPPSDDVI